MKHILIMKGDFLIMKIIETGNDLLGFVKKLQGFAIQTNSTIESEFNGINFTVSPTSTVQDIIIQYQSNFGERYAKKGEKAFEGFRTDNPVPESKLSAAENEAIEETENQRFAVNILGNTIFVKAPANIPHEVLIDVLIQNVLGHLPQKIHTSKTAVSTKPAFSDDVPPHLAKVLQEILNQQNQERTIDIEEALLMNAVDSFQMPISGVQKECRPNCCDFEQKVKEPQLVSACGVITTENAEAGIALSQYWASLMQDIEAGKISAEEAYKTLKETASNMDGVTVETTETRV